MKRYVTKGGKKKNKNTFGTTDYDIPMFTYRSALLIGFGTVFFIMIGNLLSSLLNETSGILQALISGVGFGLIFGSSRYLIDTKRGICKGFWITSIISGVLAGLAVFAFYQMNILI